MTARERLKRLLNKYPSLKQKLPNSLQSAWEDAISELRIWLIEKGYDPDQFELPKNCPYSYEEAMEKELRASMLPPSPPEL